MTLDRDTAVSYQRPESESLLGDSKSTPVTLGPGWESRHSNSDLVQSSKIGLEKNAPRDRYNMLFIILLLHGIGTLTPWNTLLNAKNYFTNVKLNVSLIEDTTSEDYDKLVKYNSGYVGYVLLCLQLPNLLFNIMNLFVQFGARSLGPRIAVTVFVESVLFVLTLVLIMLDTSTWPIVYFIIMMAFTLLFGSAGGIYQNSIYGLAANLPGKYTGAIVLGTNISGTMTALVNILSIYAAPDPKTAAVYYFISALFIMLLCLDTYFALPLLKIYRFYQKKSTNDGSGSSQNPSILGAFKESWFNCFNVFLCFFASLACFPAVASDIVALDEDFFLSGKYFQEVYCFLFFNLFAMIGNIIPMFIRYPRTPAQSFFPLLLRLLFVPFFLMCNFEPGKRIFAVWFSDYSYVVGMVLLGLSHGHFSSLAMMQATHNVSDKYVNIVGMMSAVFLVLGIFIGGNSIFFVKYFFLKR